jgi:hypothetical protein
MSGDGDQARAFTAYFESSDFKELAKKNNWGKGVELRYSGFMFDKVTPLKHYLTDTLHAYMNITRFFHDVVVMLQVQAIETWQPGMGVPAYLAAQQAAGGQVQAKRLARWVGTNVPDYHKASDHPDFGRPLPQVLKSMWLANMEADLLPKKKTAKTTKLKDTTMKNLQARLSPNVMKRIDHPRRKPPATAEDMIAFLKGLSAEQLLSEAIISGSAKAELESELSIKKCTKGFDVKEAFTGSHIKMTGNDCRQFFGPNAGGRTLVRLLDLTLVNLRCHETSKAKDIVRDLRGMWAAHFAEEDEKMAFF